MLEDGRARWASRSRPSQHDSRRVRTGRASPALLDRIARRLLRRPRRRSSRWRTSPRPRRACSPSSRTTRRDQGDREGHQRSRPRPQPDQRRQRHPCCRCPRSPRSAAASSSRSSATLAEEGRVAVRNVRRDGMTDLQGARDEGEAAPRTRSSAPRTSSRSSPTPTSREIDSCLDGQGSRDPARSERAGAGHGARAAPRRHHHGRQRPLGQRRGLPSPRGTGPAPTPSAHRARRRRPRHPGAHGVLVLHRELEPARPTRSRR